MSSSKVYLKWLDTGYMTSYVLIEEKLKLPQYTYFEETIIGSHINYKKSVQKLEMLQQSKIKSQFIICNNELVLFLFNPFNRAMSLVKGITTTIVAASTAPSFRK